VLPAATGAAVQLRGVDTTAYPIIHATVVSSAGAKVVPALSENGAAVAEFKLAAGETAAFVLENAAESHGAAGNPDYVATAFKETMNFWRGWVRKSSYKGRWREMVNRSALTLKLLTYKPTGAVVAAPTFGLPEEIGGGRNWDYRFTWIRDASFTMYGLMRLGYTEEAAAFMSWLIAFSVIARLPTRRPTSSLLRFVQRSSGAVFGILGTMITFGFLAFLIPFYFFFFSISFPSVVEFCRELIPHKNRANTMQLLGKMDRAIIHKRRNSLSPSSGNRRLSPSSNNRRVNSESSNAAATRASGAIDCKTRIR
jgi:hypothetical protein